MTDITDNSSIATLGIPDFKAEFHTVRLTLQWAVALNAKVRTIAFRTCSERTDATRLETTDGLQDPIVHDG